MTQLQRLPGNAGAKEVWQHLLQAVRVMLDA